MRLTKDNIDKYLNQFSNLDLYGNNEITHIDYLDENIKYISIGYSNVVEITCKLPEGLNWVYCRGSKLNRLPLLPKSLTRFDGRDTDLPYEFKVDIWDDNIRCNRLRNLQLLELI